jgi:uncharacterized membrane protein
MNPYDTMTAWGTVCGAAATFLAVIVALFYPIFTERKRKQEREAQKNRPPEGGGAGGQSTFRKTYP